MAFELFPVSAEEQITGYDATATKVEHALEGATIADFALMAGVDPEELLMRAERAALEVEMRAEPDSVVRHRLEIRWLDLDRTLRPEAYELVTRTKLVSPISEAIAQMRFEETDPRVAMLAQD